MNCKKRMAWAKDEMVKKAVQCALERDAFLYRKDEQAAELETIAQTHEVLNYVQELPVEPQEESKTVTDGKDFIIFSKQQLPTPNGAEWTTVSESNDRMLSMSVLKTKEGDGLDLDYLEWMRQQAEKDGSQAFRGDPNIAFDDFFDYIEDHSGQKLTFIMCHDCHNVAIDTPSQMRKNNPFVFVHGWGWHCPSCAMEVGKS